MTWLLNSAAAIDARHRTSQRWNDIAAGLVVCILADKKRRLAYSTDNKTIIFALIIITKRH